MEIFKRGDQALVWSPPCAHQGPPADDAARHEGIEMAGWLVRNRLANAFAPAVAKPGGLESTPWDSGQRAVRLSAAIEKV